MNVVHRPRRQTATKYGWCVDVKPRIFGWAKIRERASLGRPTGSGSTRYPLPGL